MEIGNQIKQLRLRRGITQEEIAQHFGVTSQAVSKWERGAASPDISMLPAISAYFGVTIDALFALSDDTQMERIENMIWDEHYLKEADVSAAREFLLDKARREPHNGKPHSLLAQMEVHLAREHHDMASQYAKESLLRDPEQWEPLMALIHSMLGKEHDWNYCNHYLLIDYYKTFLEANPSNWHAYLPLLDQLIDDFRLDEANECLARFASIHSSYRIPLYEGMIAWQGGDRENAFRIWTQMEKDYPEQWCVWHNVGDYLVRSGQADRAIAYYRKALEVQKQPPLLDPLEAIAQLEEIRGHFHAALEAKLEQLEWMEKGYQLTTGEEVESVRREIARLKARIEKTTTG